MVRKIILVVFAVVLMSSVYAQDKMTGRIFENKTTVALFGIKVENLRLDHIVVSDTGGRFAIEARIGDRLKFSGNNYKPDTALITDLKSLTIFLVPNQNQLKEVKITNAEIKTGSLTAAPDVGPLGSETVKYQTDGSGSYIGGIKFMLFDSHSDEKKRIRDGQIAADEQKKEEIAAIFSPRNLQAYLPIKGQEMDNFIILYIPDVKTYTNIGFNLAAYLNFSYKDFMKIPQQKRRSKDFLKLTGK